MFLYVFVLELQQPAAIHPTLRVKDQGTMAEDDDRGEKHVAPRASNCDLGDWGFFNPRDNYDSYYELSNLGHVNPDDSF